MKKIFTALTLLVTLNAVAQSPEKMSYQAVIRNASGELVASQEVGIQLSILKGSSSASAEYTEATTPTTNANGLISIEFGGQSGWDIIDWTEGPYFIKTETDIDNDGTYDVEGISQLLSVPFALHAKTAESVTDLEVDYSDIKNKPDISNSINIAAPASGDMAYYDGTKWVRLPKGTNGQVLKINNNAPTWETESQASDIPAPSAENKGQVLMSDGDKYTTDTNYVNKSDSYGSKLDLNHMYLNFGNKLHLNPGYISTNTKMYLNHTTYQFKGDPFYFGDEYTDGSWKIVVENGSAGDSSKLVLYVHHLGSFKKVKEFQIVFN